MPRLAVQPTIYTWLSLLAGNFLANQLFSYTLGSREGFSVSLWIGFISLENGIIVQTNAVKS